MYAKLDDRFFSNPKARAAGPNGRALYIAGLCHCAAHLTDGFIRADMLPVIAAEAEVPQTVADTLVTVRLWIPADCGWDVHEYLETNQSKQQVEAKRAADRERQARKRTGGDPEGESRAPSRRDSQPTPHVVQSSPVLDGKPSSSSVLPVDNATAQLVDDVCDAVADLRTAKAKAAGSIKSSEAGFRRSTRANLPAEIGPRVLELAAAYDEPARRLAEIIEGTLNGRNARRRETVA